MPRKKKDTIPRLVVPAKATLRQIYARARAEFTAADLQKFTEIDDGIPVEQIIAEMEAIQREEAPSKKKS